MRSWPRWVGSSSIRPGWPSVHGDFAHSRLSKRCIVPWRRRWLRRRPRNDLRLIRAHPDLGARARMSAASEGEQAGAGLDRLTAAAFQQLQEWNTAYREKFGFPFIRGEGQRQARDPRSPRKTASRIARDRTSRGTRTDLSNCAIPAGEHHRMHHFVTFSKRNYYGKDDVIAYRLNRDGQTPAGQCPVFGANVRMLMRHRSISPALAIPTRAYRNAARLDRPGRSAAEVSSNVALPLKHGSVPHQPVGCDWHSGRQPPLD